MKHEDANASHAHYKKFLISLLKLFEEKRPLLENRGAFIIRYSIRISQFDGLKFKKI